MTLLSRDTLNEHLRDHNNYKQPMVRTAGVRAAEQNNIAVIIHSKEIKRKYELKRTVKGFFYWSSV